MGSFCGTGKGIDRTVTLRPADDADSKSVEYSKSLASPNSNGLTSPKQRFARRTSAHKGVMSSIAMKFPHIKRSFVACKEVFERYAESEPATIPKSMVTEVLVELGARPEALSKGSVEQIIATSNLDGDEVIDFKEFLIAAAVGCFLRADPVTDDLSPRFLSIRKGFEAAKEAFGKIDKDGSGEIEFQELKEAFLAMKEDELIMERLKELDFNGDKSIEFPEFVWGLSAWVGMDEDLDDEAEDGRTPPVAIDNVENDEFQLDRPPPAQKMEDPADPKQPEEAQQPLAVQEEEELPANDAKGGPLEEQKGETEAVADAIGDENVEFNAEPDDQAVDAVAAEEEKVEQ